MRRLFAAVLITASATIALGAYQPAAATDPAAQADFANRVNGVRASKGLPGLSTHSVLTAKAEAWAQHMADSGCLCHPNLPDGVTVGWRKLGENIGRGPSVAAVHAALVASPTHYANFVDPAFRWIGVGVAYSNGQMYVAEVFMDGDAPPAPNPLLAFDNRGQAIAARSQGGFWILGGNGSVGAYEGAPAYGAPTLPGGLARDIAAMPDGKGYVVLDGLGGVHRFGSALFTLSGVGGPWFGWDIARSIAVTPDGRGFTVLDGFGGRHAFGSARRFTAGPYWRGWDIARSIAYRSDGSLYELDGFGTVWTLGGAKNYGAPHFGWNIARDITVAPGDNGYVIVDGFGGMHRFGSARPTAPMPYQPVDRWRSVVEQSGTVLALRNDGFPVRV